MSPSSSSVSGALDQDQRWAGEVFVKGDLVVPVGVTLTLAAGTSLRFSPAPISRAGERRAARDPHKCAVLVRGRLVAQGTPERPVALGAGSEWGGLHLLGEGSCALASARFEDAVGEAVSLRDAASAELTDASWRRCGAGLGARGRSRARLRGGVMESPREYAIHCGGGEVDWDGGEWSGGRDGVVVAAGVARLRGVRGRGGRTGLRVEGGRCEGDALRLSGQSGAAATVAAGGEASLRGSFFEGSTAGAVSTGGRLRLTDCSFDGHESVCVDLRGRGHELTRVFLRGPGHGLVLEDADARAEGLDAACDGDAVSVRRGARLDWEGGRAAGGERGLLVAGGRARLRAVAVTGGRQGARVESGSLEADALAFSGQADAAVSVLAAGEAALRGSSAQDAPAGAVSTGGRLTLADCAFSGITATAVDLRGRGHRLERVRLSGPGLGLALADADATAVDLTVACEAGAAELRRGARLRWSGGGSAGGGILLAGGSLRLSEASIADASQGVRLESGSFAAERVRFTGHRDAGLTMLAQGDADLRDCVVSDCPVGVVTAGARLRVERTRFLSCVTACCSLETGVHLLDGCFFDPNCQAVLIAPGALARLDGRLHDHAGPRRRPSLRAAVWRAALAARRLPLLGALCRLPYRVAVAVVREWARRDPGVRTALIGRGWVTGDLDPGVSDLDFILLVEPLGGAAGAAWLERFWTAYGRWRKVFPFLGEVLVAEPADAAAYLSRGGVRAAEQAPHTVALHGPGLPRPDGPLLEQGPAQALQECAHAYTRFTHSAYFLGYAPPEVAALRRRKAAVDLLRYGAASEGRLPLPVPTRGVFLAGLPDGRPALLDEPLARQHASLLRRFHDAAGAFLRAEGARPADAAAPRVTWRAPVVGAPPPADELARRRGVVARLRACFGDALRAALLDDAYRSYLVLEDGAVEDEQRAAGLLAGWERLCREAPVPGPMPLVMSRTLWDAWRRLPYLEAPTRCLEFGDHAVAGESWASAGRVFPRCRQYRWGPAEAVAAPSDALTRRLALESAANLRLTWRHLGSPAAGVSAVYALHYLLSRALGLRLLLDAHEGVSFFELDALTARFSERFPEHAADLARLPPPDWVESPRAAVLGVRGFVEEQIGMMGAA